MSFGGALQAGGTLGTGASLALGGTTHAGGALGTGASLALGGAAHSGGAVGTGGTSSSLVCGTKITDLEDGTGRICEGVEGRRGVWYAFNDGTGVQWPVPTTPGVAIETSEVLPERNGSRRAIHSTASGFTYWGAGVGFDVAFDGATYGLYDASAYDGISFWAKGNVATPGASFEFRVSTADTTLTKYGGRCASEPCHPPLAKSIHPHDEWAQYWVPFVSLGTLPRGELTNVQFKSYAAFDLWVDDVAFFVGPANCCPAQCQTNFTVPDPILESYIRSAGGNGSKPLTCGDVCYLNELSATGGVQSLTGLECSPQLAMLGLQSNQITDLSPLAQLSWLSQLYLNGNRITHLQTLILANNQIENVKPLMGLPLTGKLDLSYNDISDLSQFTALNSVASIDLSYNQVKVVDLHGGLTSVTWVNLANNPLTSVPASFELPNLTSIDLSWGNLTDATGLASAPLLTQIMLPHNSMSDLATLSGLKSVQSIDMSYNSLSTLATAPSLPTLQSLTLASNHITNLTGIERFPALTGLDLQDNQLSELAPIAALVNLFSLNLSHNPVLENLSPLAQLKQLSTLDISYSNLHDIQALSALAVLASLNISNNHVADIGALSYLNKLQDVDASTNDIASIANLAGVEVQWLNLSHNQISDIGSLVNVTYIPWSTGRSWGPAFLDLSYNRISDLTSFANSSGLSTNLDVDMSSNPIDCVAQAANIAKIKKLVFALDTDCR